MPYFVGVTPIVVGEPITISFVWIDGTVKSARTNLIDGMSPSSAQVAAFTSAKAQLSNAGMFKWKGAGQINEISKVVAIAHDELYAIETILRVEFASASDPSLVMFDRIPAIDAGVLAGYALDVSGSNPEDAAIQAYLTAALAIANTGAAGDFLYSASVLEGVDAETRTLPVADDPLGNPPA